MTDASKFCNKSLTLPFTNAMIRFYVFAIFVLLVGCKNGKDKPDVSDIKVDVRIERFEQSFFKIDTNNIASGLADLRNAFPRFYPVFMQDILQVNPMDSNSFVVVKNIINGYRPINDSIQKKYSDLGWLKDELTEGFKYVKHYYPEYNVPGVITFIATLDAPGVVLTPDHLGIGLHQYAGKNFSVYQAEPVLQMYPSYISRRFDKEYISANCIKAIADDIYPDKTAGKPLIEQMVEKGKHWFLLDKFLPDAPDSVKTGYTKKQLDWAKDNEGNVWAYIVKNENDIYSIDPATIQTYIGEAPNTQVMTEASPGNIGQWVGWRIVQEYAAKHAEASLQQILETPAKTIFEESKYKPK
jgi:hypothetical protein